MKGNRQPLIARPKQGIDRKSLREKISDRFSKALKYLANSRGDADPKKGGRR